MTQLNENPIYTVNRPYIKISGNACSEDSADFWIPVVRDFEIFSDEWESLHVDFRFNYYNTGTLFFLTRLFTILKEMSESKPVEINWYYYKNDTDMYEIGKEFYDTVTKRINLIETK